MSGRLTLSRHLLVVGSMMPLLSCDGEDLFTGPLTSEACSQVGVRHSGDESPRTWRSGMSPHVLMDSVRIEGKLVIEPGSVWNAGSALFASDLEAIGSESLPIVFTSVAAGMDFEEAGAIVHARIENTGRAVWSQTGYELENVHILRSQRLSCTRSARVHPPITRVRRR